MVYRNDLLKSMQQHLVIPLRAAGHADKKAEEDLDLEETQMSDVTQQLVHTLVDQAHLSPLPATAAPGIVLLYCIHR